MGFQQIITAFGFNFLKEFSYAKKPNTLRVLQWNVSGWDEKNKRNKGGISFRPLMMDLVKKQDADVLCFEEFFEPKDTDNYVPNISSIVKMGYPYHYYIPSKKMKMIINRGLPFFQNIQ